MADQIDDHDLIALIPIAGRRSEKCMMSRSGPIGHGYGLFSLRMLNPRWLGAVALLLLLAACSHEKDITGPPVVVAPDTNPPTLQREMRGLWVATVANIDWPSRSHVDRGSAARGARRHSRSRGVGGLQRGHLPRSAGGRRGIPSSIEPWASMLSGTQGTDPGYDPLAFAVQEAHARGLQLHAWINPFRAGNRSDTTRLAPTHLFKARRDLVRVYGTNSGSIRASQTCTITSMRVVTDIVQRYDIDGIHADDYFYPYPENDAANRVIEFPG